MVARVVSSEACIKRTWEQDVLGLPDYAGARRVMISVGDTH